MQPRPVIDPPTTLTTRTPKREDIPAILAIFDSEVRAGKMLPRSAADIAAHLDHWRVIEDGQSVIGCVSLVFFNQELCELRSLAVDEGHRGAGLGGKLIQAALEMARQHNMQRVLTLTRSTGLFERHGFRRDVVSNFPEKVWQDCEPCPLKHICDEVALIYHL